MIEKRKADPFSPPGVSWSAGSGAKSGFEADAPQARSAGFFGRADCGGEVVELEFGDEQVVGLFVDRECREKAEATGRVRREIVDQCDEVGTSVDRVVDVGAKAEKSDGRIWCKCRS